ncbi:GTPase-activating protein [Elasticomyces elasticus]|nr:GTPase-activating protein [Elasticomyces elasticus]KAK3650645.1 GTPase-activating protein [Elasticomyces elasticus]KAK4913978.1 GTPase-activating protein [Elasticomyces elasticus]KAK5753142.1 GTPase-activating protein [Elasticomyces elasticus]
MDLIRDTTFGRLVRLITRDKVFRYQEELDPEAFVRRFARKPSIALSPPPSLIPADGPISSIDSASTASPKVSSDGKKPSVATDHPADRCTSGPDPEKETHDGIELAVDHHLVDWYSTNDPDIVSKSNELVDGQEDFRHRPDLSSDYRHLHRILDLYAEHLHVSEVAATLGLTLFVLGYAMGPIIFSSMSEVPFIGRAPVYLGTLAVFVAFQGPTTKASNFGMLMAFRYLSGVFGSPVLATGGASVADMYAASKRAYALSIWGVAFLLGPALGPTIGGYVTQYGTIDETFTAAWQWPMFTLMWLSAFCLIILFFCLPETSSSNILYHRAQRLRTLTGNPNLMSQAEIMAQQMTGSEVLNMVVVHPFTLNFTEPMVFLLNLYSALIYGLLYLWFDSFPIVFNEGYGFTTGQAGLAFLGIPIGVFVVVPPLF